GIQSLFNSVINIGVIEFVFAIVEQEKLQRLVHKRFVIRIAQSAAHQHGGAVADVAGNDFIRKFGLAKIAKHGIDGICQVDAGINQRAVKVKDQQFQPAGGDGTVAVNHSFSVYPEGQLRI